MYWLNHYVVDWDKVQTLDDMKRLMKAMNITFEPDYEGLEDIKYLLRLESKSKAPIVY
jgi:hypothetical protein